MKSLFYLYVKSEWRNQKKQYLKQCLYIIPIIVITLVLSSTQNIKYYNQKEFLSNTKYSSIHLSAASDDESAFEVYDAALAVATDVRGVMVYDYLYSCQLFNIIQTGIDYEETYFTRKNLNNFNVDSLGENGIVISYDVAKRLKVDVGDRIYLISYESDAYIECIVQAVMKTKYQYGQIGAVGTAVMNSVSNEALKVMYGDAVYYSFSDDESGSVTVFDELRECNVLALPAMSVLMVNVIFPVMGGILLMLIASREIRSVIRRMRYNCAVLVSQGAECSLFQYVLVFVEGIVFVIAITISMFLYKYLLLEQLIGQYIGFYVLIRYYLLMVVISFIIIFLNVRYLMKEVNADNVMEFLRKEVRLN